MKIIICDDDKELLKKLRVILKKSDYEFYKMQIETCERGDALIEYCRNEFFDLIILDIEMPNKNGIITAQCLREEGCYTPIVYLTNYPNYKEKAFGVHAFAYLEKPIDEEKLLTIVQDVKNYHPPKKDNKLNFFSNGEVLTLQSSEIIFIEYHFRKLKIATVENTYDIKEKIGELGQYLKPYGFTVPHKSFIVNLGWIKKIQGFDLILKNETMIPIAQRRAKVLREEWNKYLQNTYEMIGNL